MVRFAVSWAIWRDSEEGNVRRSRAWIEVRMSWVVFDVFEGSVWIVMSVVTELLSSF